MAAYGWLPLYQVNQVARVGYLQGCLYARDTGTYNQSIRVKRYFFGLQRLMIGNSFNCCVNQCLGFLTQQ